MKLDPDKLAAHLARGLAPVPVAQRIRSVVERVRLDRGLRRAEYRLGAGALQPGAEASASFSAPVAAFQSFSKSVRVVWISRSISCPASSTESFIFLSSSRSIARLTSALTSET